MLMLNNVSESESESILNISYLQTERERRGPTYGKTDGRTD